MKAAVLHQTAEWHPALHKLVEKATLSTMTSFAVRSAEPVPPWQTSNVTLIGDALHNMTPFRGLGANMALRDAEALTKTLLTVERGDAQLVPALSAFEQDMIRTGFAAVRASLAEMERLHSRSSLKLATTKVMLRVADAVPALQRRFRGKR
jgi:2-polyprenyl-6-methoxyphenol hydroxylase-like FAD-dependent oxidoreductase